ncbi:hypothetical protein [Rhizocola hellebori]|nr:hypothetical protein [Rhizocola hellebori]
MRKWIAVAAALLLAGCASPTSETSSVVVAPYNASTIPFKTLQEFLAHRPVIATGRVVAVNDRAYEVPVDPNAEGNTETDGPEIFGTVSFKVESVLKGDLVPGATMTIIYMSGKWNTLEKESRIAYTYEHMANLQKNDGTLKTPAEFNGATFAIFAQPNEGSIPVKENNLYRGRVAPIDAGGQVTFPRPAPFESSATAAVKLDDIKAAIGR